jgi:hypothetical protein
MKDEDVLGQRSDEFVAAVDMRVKPYVQKPMSTHLFFDGRRTASQSQP